MKTGETAPFTSKVTLFKVKSQYLKMRYHFFSLSLFPRVWTSELVSCHVSGHICVVVAWYCISFFSSLQGESDSELASLLQCWSFFCFLFNVRCKDETVCSPSLSFESQVYKLFWCAL